MDSKDQSNKCVKDAHGNCSRWCDHREGKGKKVADEVIPTLVIGGKMKHRTAEFDVNNVVVRNIITDHAHGEQTVDLTVVLTRPIPDPKEQR